MGMLSSQGATYSVIQLVEAIESVVSPGVEFRSSCTCVGLNQEETLVVVVSKTFTTAETMLNARTVRAWLTAKLGPESIPKHMVAVSTNKKLVKQFGIDTDNMFGFWDWVGGRYSVCSAVGVLPLALQYGFEQCQLFLEGAHSMDEHFRTADFDRNIPVMMGLLSVWNSSFLGYSSRAILPYCQALSKLAPHIQQVLSTVSRMFCMEFADNFSQIAGGVQPCILFSFDVVMCP
jgi:glucose-6-phosphate isomerase